MLEFDIYAIRTDDDERSGSVKELFTSFDDAMNARYKYANWFCPRGDVWINLYKAYHPFKCAHTWHINKEGKIINEYEYKII